MIPSILLLNQVDSLPNAPGISRAIAAGARVWDMFHPDSIRVRPEGATDDLWQGIDGNSRSYLALFPEFSGGSPVEFFLSPDLDQGERGTLTNGSIRWDNGEYSRLRFPRPDPFIQPDPYRKQLGR